MSYQPVGCKLNLILQHVLFGMVVVLKLNLNFYTAPTRHHALGLDSCAHLPYLPTPLQAKLNGLH